MIFRFDQPANCQNPKLRTDATCTRRWPGAEKNMAVYSPWCVCRVEILKTRVICKEKSWYMINSWYIFIKFQYSKTNWKFRLRGSFICVFSKQLKLETLKESNIFKKKVLKQKIPPQKNEENHPSKKCLKLSNRICTLLASFTRLMGPTSQAIFTGRSWQKTNVAPIHGNLI